MSEETRTFSPNVERFARCDLTDFHENQLGLAIGQFRFGLAHEHGEFVHVQITGVIGIGIGERLSNFLDELERHAESEIVRR